ncbi:MAG: bifunctional methylenetetrahydrofolate dehydrogenase/methenyltetrahydrofolate cyclohydrolase FolD, partial [Alphaproteobacteria bacterium]|nr:bifunctional methylenetetrahydrofolate dehydrogenase/methenyltetrahydrofolate cyclohydrolase FolD [Alphaproteobacteria bacterium]
AALIDGKAFAEGLRQRIGTCAAEFEARAGRKAGLAVVLVGEDPASQVYVRSKVKQTAEAGMRSEERRLPAEISQDALLAEVRRLNADPAVHGILVQMPLPPHIDAARVLAAIDPAKDVDGLTPASAGRLFHGAPGLVPCTPLGCMILIGTVRASLAGLEAVVLGRSVLVGRPMAMLLLGRDATVTLAHSRTRDLPALAARADILVAAVGRPGLVRGDWIKPGATVIDVGINRVPAGPDGKTRLVGDVAFAEAEAVAGAITPVPGGVGPMTVACLLSNCLAAAAESAGLDPRPFLPEAVRAAL